MTQYHQERSPTATTETTDAQIVKEQNSLERRLNSLTERVQQQNVQIRDMEKLLRKLQNEVRLAVNTFNLTNRG